MFRSPTCWLSHNTEFTTEFNWPYQQQPNLSISVQVSNLAASCNICYAEGNMNHAPGGAGMWPWVEKSHADTIWLTSWYTYFVSDTSSHCASHPAASKPCRKNQGWDSSECLLLSSSSLAEQPLVFLRACGLMSTNCCCYVARLPLKYRVVASQLARSSLRS